MPGPKRFYAEHPSGYRAEWTGGSRIHIYQGDAPVDSPGISGFDHSKGTMSDATPGIPRGWSQRRFEQQFHRWVRENGDAFNDFNHPTDRPSYGERHGFEAAKSEDCSACHGAGCMFCKGETYNPERFGMHDGFKVREYPLSGPGPWITGHAHFCDACSPRDPQQASRHNVAPSKRCEHPEHDSNVVLHGGGMTEPTEYEEHHRNPDVVGWAKDDFSGRGNDVALCASCAEDKRARGHDMEPYYPLTKNRLMPEDSCSDCGHDLHQGRKEAALSPEEERELTSLPPLDLSRDDPGRCSNCGGTLAPGESGLCPQCAEGGGARKQRQKQKQVRTRGGGVEQRQGMHAVLDRIWRQAGISRSFEDAERAHSQYRGNSSYVPIANKTWMHKDTDGNTHIRHHRTDIMSFSPEGHITLDFDGWRSMTTTQRVNAFLPNNMKFMSNPSKARGAPSHVVAHNPSGESIFPDHDYRHGEGARERTKGKYGLHRDTVLHPFEDGFSINLHTGERLPDGHVRPGTIAQPPRGRGSGDAPAPGSGPRRSRGWYNDDTYDHDNATRLRNLQQSPYAPPQRHDPYERHNRHNMEDTGPDDSSTHRQVGDRFEHLDPMPQSDMPEHGESFDDWMKRTTPAQTKFDKCHNCRGKGVTRSGTGDDYRKSDCGTCKGSGFLTGDGHPAEVNEETGRLHDPREKNPFQEALERGGTPTGRGISDHPYNPGRASSGPCHDCGEGGPAHTTAVPLENRNQPPEHEHGDNLGGPCRNCGRNTDSEGVCMNLQCSHFSRFAGEPHEPWPGQSTLSMRQASRQVDLEQMSERYLAGLRVLAYGETKAPTSVDTLRDEDCPVCGEHDAFDGDQCDVCGFVAPPKMFQDPDLDKAHQMDLRQDPATGEPNDTSPDLQPIDPNQVGDQGQVPGAESGFPKNEEAYVEVETEGLEDQDVSGPGDDATELAHQQMQQIQDSGAPLTPEQLGPNGEVTGGPEDPEAAATHFDQGGEPFTPGPNAPSPQQPMEQGMEQEEQPFGQAEDGQQEQEIQQAGPGRAGDATADLMCPACGFQAGASQPTSTPGNMAEPADMGDGMLAGDVCPNCSQATLLSAGEMEQMQQAQQVPVG